MIVIGLDILPGTSSLGSNEKKSKFSMTILQKVNPSDDSSITVLHEVEEVDLRDLISVIHKIKPNYIAFDNLQEIAADTNELITFAKKIQESSIVQVNGNPSDGFQKLQNLAVKNNFWDHSRGKPDPLQSSYLIARLVIAGIGYKVALFEDEVKITISKTRGIGRGGWSQPRYERNMRISVNNVAKEIQNYLDEFNIEFDVFNYSKSIIYVIQLSNNSYIKYSDILTQAKKFSNELAFAHVQKIPKSSLEYIPLSIQAPKKTILKSTESIIVGLDPGTTTGLAIISARTGGVLSIFSAREFSTSQIIRKITKYGKTVLVCADVNYPPPHAVQRLSRMLGVQIYAPSSRATPRTEKRNLVQDYLDKFNITDKADNHQRDALFAAIKGFNSIKPKISSILEITNQKLELKKSTDKIIDLVLSGISIHDAVTLIEAQINAQTMDENLDQFEKQNNIHIPIDIVNLARNQFYKMENIQLSLRLLEKDKKNLEKENERLNQLNQTLMNKIDRLENSFQIKLERDKVVQQKTVEIINLEKALANSKNDFEKQLHLIEQLQRIRSIWIRGEQVPLKPIQKMHFDELEKAHKEFGIRSGDVLLILDPSGGSTNTAKWLVERKVRVIIIPKGFKKRLSHLASNIFELAELPILEEEIMTYKQEQNPNDRKRKIVLYEDLYIINKRYLLQRIYETGLEFIKKREFLRIKKHREELPQELDIDKNSFEYLLMSYQNQRVNARAQTNSFNDFDGDTEDENLF
jgi:predicted RNase H-like nuclease (RuvC/YqgF family)